MREELLIRGAELLEADAAKPDGVQFDMATWVKPSVRQEGADAYAFAFVPEEKPPISCATSACAMGLFCLSGAFEEEGLSYHFAKHGGGYVLLPNITDDAGYQRDGFLAAAELFDISYEDASYLFDPDNYPDNKVTGAEAELYVANRIREYILGNIDEQYHDDYRNRDSGIDEDSDDNPDVFT